MEIIQPSPIAPSDKDLAGVWTEAKWIRLEGFILDRKYLRALQQRFADHRGAFCGYGVATPNLQKPPVDWDGKDTFIQKDGINKDFGLFDTPDDFYAQHGVNLSGVKRWLYARVIRHGMNRNVHRIRVGYGRQRPLHKSRLWPSSTPPN